LPVMKPLRAKIQHTKSACCRLRAQYEGVPLTCTNGPAN
jgi:hypothetical protein